jgi:D-alanyl-lipoteichoic acid acyltransferase DltB (MBOAT superfamily)
LLEIYGDFQGSDMALGMSKLFGIDLLLIIHISPEILLNSGANGIFHVVLVSDYVYIPLGGSSGGIGMKINTFIIFFVKWLAWLMDLYRLGLYQCALFFCRCYF